MENCLRKEVRKNVSSDAKKVVRPSMTHLQRSVTGAKAPDELPRPAGTDSSKKSSGECFSPKRCSTGHEKEASRVFEGTTRANRQADSTPGEHLHFHWFLHIGRSKGRDKIFCLKIRKPFFVGSALKIWNLRNSGSQRAPLGQRFVGYTLGPAFPSESEGRNQALTLGSKVANVSRIASSVGSYFSLGGSHYGRM